MNKHSEPFEQQAIGNTKHETYGNRWNSKCQKTSKNLWDSPCTEFNILESLDRVEQDNAYDIIEYSFAIHNGEQLGLIIIANHRDGSNNITRAQKWAYTQYLKHRDVYIDVFLLLVVPFLE